jgi:hypothetical protein
MDALAEAAATVVVEAEEAVVEVERVETVDGALRC